MTDRVRNEKDCAARASSCRRWWPTQPTSRLPREWPIAAQ